MKQLKRVCIAALPLALCGCLEVNQHPAWLNGGYAGKIDQLPYQQLFHRDRLAWFATISNRNLHQNEYVRAKPPGMAGAKRLQDIGATPAQNTGQAGAAAPGTIQPAVDLAATRITTPAVAYSPGAAMPAPAAGTPAPAPGAMAAPAPGTTPAAPVPVPGATAVPPGGTAQPQPGTPGPAAAGTAPRPATR
jgi:hypothetical protein